MTSWPVWGHSSHKAVWGHQNTLQTWILFKVKVFLHFLNPISEFIGNTPSCFRKPYIIIYDFFLVTLGSPIPYRRLGSPIPYSRLGSPIPYNSLRSPIKNVVWEFITWLIFWLRDCIRHSLYILCNYYMNSIFHLDFYSVKRKHSDLYDDKV